MARPASDIRIRVLHAARERFLLQGVDGASLRQIAHDAGTNIGMVYYYFKTKDELFLAVVEEVYVLLLADLTQALADDVLPELRIERLYQRIARVNDTEFKVMRLVMREALISSARLQSVVARFQSGHLPLIGKVLAQGFAEQRFRSDLHPMVIGAATACLGIIPQIMHRLLSASELPVAALLPSTEQAAHELREVLLSGIAGPQLARERSR